MPCYDSRSEPAYVRGEVIAELQPKIDKLAAMLCWALQVVEAAHGGMPPEIAEWWTEHKAHDAKAGHVNQFK